MHFKAAIIPNPPKDSKKGKKSIMALVLTFGFHFIESFLLQYDCIKTTIKIREQGTGNRDQHIVTLWFLTDKC